MENHCQRVRRNRSRRVGNRSRSPNGSLAFTAEGTLARMHATAKNPPRSNSSKIVRVFSVISNTPTLANVRNRTKGIGHAEPFCGNTNQRRVKQPRKPAQPG